MSSFPAAASQPGSFLCLRTTLLTSGSWARTATPSARSPPALQTALTCCPPRCTTVASCRSVAALVPPLAFTAEAMASPFSTGSGFARNVALQDVFLRRSEQQWHTAVKAVPTLSSHVRLLRQWAWHRALEGQPDGVTGHLLTMFAVYLVQQGVLVRVHATFSLMPLPASCCTKS